MKVILALVVLVVALSHAAHADEELANKLKPFEAFSPYKWTQWVALRPSHRPVAAAAVAYAPQPDYSQFQNANSVDSTEDDDDDDDDDEDEAEYDSLNGGVSAFANWFKRAILPQPPPAPENKKATETKETKKAKKVKAPKVPTTKKPSIVEIPPGFWAPPPSVAPNVTLPPPPGYYAAKKSMFISKLFAALAKSVLNETEPATPAPPAPATTAPAPATPAPAPVEAVTTTTTISPRQAILDEISQVLLSDVTRSLPSSYEDVTREPEEFDDSDEDSDEEDNSAVSKKGKPTPPPVNPFLLSQIDFLAKLTEAIAASQQKPTEAPVTTPKPRPTKPTTTAAPKETKKSAKKASKKSAKKLAKTPAYMKWIPTTTTPSPTPAQPEVAAPAAGEIDYDALARALLGSSKA